MKKFLLLGVASFLLSTSVFARETNSMRSSTELVTVGDSEESLLQKMGKPRPRFFVYEDGRFDCSCFFLPVSFLNEQLEKYHECNCKN